MPIYEYACPKCGEFEFTQRITEDALTRCPTCRSKVKKLISNTSFHLKGSGWYVTDYGRKDGAATKDGGTSKATTASSEPAAPAKTESSASKPAESSTATAGKTDRNVKAA